jgi:hypothetical protein
MTMITDRPSPFRGRFDRMLFAIPPFVQTFEPQSTPAQESSSLKGNLETSMWHRYKVDCDPKLHGVLAYLDSLI